MARVTVEDCLARVPNRFALTILASRRARALSEGRGNALVACDNKEGVTALREISEDRVRFKEDVESTMTDFIEEQRRQLRVTAGEHTFLEAASLKAFEDEEEEERDEEDLDVEELHPDPEKLGKQAVDDVEEDDSSEEEDGEPEAEGEGEDETSDDEAIDDFDESLPDEADAPDDVEEEASEDEETESEPAEEEE